MSLVVISNKNGASLGLTFLLIFSIIICYQKSKKKIKVENITNILKNNQVYFFKIFVIFCLINPGFVLLSNSFLLTLINSLFYFIFYATENLIKLDFFFVLGFYLFKLFLLPFWQIFLFFYNFLVAFQVYNVFVFLELFIILYGGLWFGIGFFTTVKRQLSLHKNLKLLILDLLGLFVGFNYLILNKLLYNQEDGAKSHKEIKTFLNEILFGFSFNFITFLKNLKKLLLNFFEILNEKLVVFNKLENNLLKIYFVITKIIDLVYFLYIWYVRIYWGIYIIRCTTLLLSLERIKQFISKN